MSVGLYTLALGRSDHFKCHNTEVEAVNSIHVTPVVRFLKCMYSYQLSGILI